VRTQLARLLVDRGDDEAALEEIGRSLRMDPRNLELHLLTATVHERRGALAEAADHLAAALAIDTDHLEANRRLGTILGQLGDTRGAIRCWRRVIARGGGDAEVVTALGIGLSSDGQHTEAIQLLGEVTVGQPEESAAHANLGTACLAAGRLDEAVKALSRALELDPQSAQAHCGLGVAYQRQGRWHEAAEAFTTTEQLAPGSPVGPLNLGLVLDALGDKEGARRALLRAAAIDPDDEEIRLALEQVLMQAAQESAGATPPPATQVTAGEGAIAGDLKSFQIFDVLEFLRLQTKTGALVVNAKAGTGTVRITRGAVTGAAAPSVTPLGELLVKRRLITTEDLVEARDKLGPERAQSEEALAGLLLSDELVDRERLGKAILDQVMGALDEMLTWTEGTFSFRPETKVEDPPLSFDLQEVMLELMRTSDERKHAARTAT
jgi:Flp pilus assembly protein TadD